MLQQQTTNRKLFETGVTISQLAGITGIPDSKISPWLRGTKPLSNDNFLLIDQTLNDVAELIELVKPIPLDTRNVMVIRDLLKKFKAGELDYLKLAKQMTDDPRNAEAIEKFKSEKVSLTIR